MSQLPCQRIPPILMLVHVMLMKLSPVNRPVETKGTLLRSSLVSAGRGAAMQKGHLKILGKTLPALLLARDCPESVQRRIAEGERVLLLMGWVLAQVKEFS